jgi:hypothetical protein
MHDLVVARLVTESDEESFPDKCQLKLLLDKGGMLE